MIVSSGEEYYLSAPQLVKREQLKTRAREREARERDARDVRKPWKKFVSLQAHSRLANEIVTLSRVIMERLMTCDNCLK